VGRASWRRHHAIHFPGPDETLSGGLHLSDQHVGTVSEVGVAPEDWRAVDNVTLSESYSSAARLEAPRAAAAYGERLPAPLDRAVIAVTSVLPGNWFGLRLAIALRRIVTMRMTGDGGFDVVRWGLRMRLHPRRNGCEKGALFTPQMYETPERRELAAEIDKSKAAGRPFVFIDIGANVGLFSLFVASRAGADARILAIEPEPENLRRLRFNVTSNPGIPIRVAAVALDEKPGRVAIETNLRDRGGTRTQPLDRHSEAGVVEVECLPLQDALDGEGIRSIDALKIDVEGAEDRVLVPFFRDAPESLWPGFILIEDSRGAWRTDLFALFAERGYAVAARTKQNVMLRRAAAGTGV
jgi:FkbM family methyltransferase